MFGVGMSIIPELESDHEEADSDLLLHAGHASDNGYDAVGIKSPVIIKVVSNNSQMYNMGIFNVSNKLISVLLLMHYCY